MERSYPVDRDFRPTDRPPASANSSAWTSPENQPALLDLMQDLLGTQAQPDPLFFVETWTLGVEAATESFRARQPITPAQDDSAPSACRPFDFTVPLIFVYDQSDFPSPPAGFSAAWKVAYGDDAHHVALPSSTHLKTPPNEVPFCTPAPNQPLTCEEACRMLGVAPTSTRQQIKTAYRQLAWRYHPDRLASSSEQEQRVATDRMTALNRAYRLLNEGI